jgi:hypothetical protein
MPQQAYIGHRSTTTLRKTSFYRIYRKIDRLVVFVSKVTANIWVGDFH